VPEVVGDGAVLVAPADRDGLAAQVMAVLDGGPEVDRLIERGRRRSQEFTWSACAQGLARLYQDAVRSEESQARARPATAR
jgi:glycosyltransferase involved in cell wall biosynthesis